jgi:hypothetical protein
MPQQRTPCADASTKPQTLLDRALDQTGSVKEVVKESANELFLVNTVLKQELPTPLLVGEVAQALKKTDELESRMQTSVGELVEVKRLLEEEITQRETLEHELTAAQTALSKSTPK